MADLEKILKGLECCAISDEEGVCPDDCPYYDECWADKIKIEKQLKKDALALLKAQEPVKYTFDFDGDLICGGCGERIDGTDNYCRTCGRKVKLDETEKDNG